MSFGVSVYVNYSENNRLRKNITLVADFTGNLRAECSIIDPVITFNASVADFAGANYMYIPTFQRYYFIRNIRSIRTDLVEITAHVDVLMSFADAILGNMAIIKRQANQWNLYLNDGSLKCYQNPMILTKAFPSGFTVQEFVLAVAGGAGSASSSNSSSVENIEA